MQREDLLFLLDYSAWANEKLLQAADRLEPEQFIAPHRTTYGSLRGILVHLLVSHQVWLSRCRDGRMPPALPAHAEFSDVATYRSRLQGVQETWRTYLAALSAVDLQRRVAYTTSLGVSYATPLWQIVMHLVNHTTQHRSEAAEVLTEYNCSPGDLDLIWYLRQAG